MTQRNFINTACPYLPDAGEMMDYRILAECGTQRDGHFFYAALCYGQHLWKCGHAGRSLLALTRGLYAELDGQELILQQYPLPYRAMSWILKNHTSDDFPGNPRLSYQHQAMRIRGKRADIRQARAWALWAIVSHIRPHLPGDSTMPEKSIQEIGQALETHGIAGEREHWASCLEAATH